MKNFSTTLHSLIALFTAIAIINIYVTDFYCSFTKESGHQHFLLALTEHAELQHSPTNEASEEHHHHNEGTEENHHEIYEPQAEHHDGDEAEEHHLDSNQPSTEHHPAGDQSEEHHHDANQPDCDHHQDDENADNCCKDNSGAFFSSLTNPSIYTVFIKSPVNTLFCPVNTFNQFFTFDTFSSSPEYLLFKPPPNIPDIRIFIQSFII